MGLYKSEYDVLICYHYHEESIRKNLDNWNGQYSSYLSYFEGLYLMKCLICADQLLVVAVDWLAKIVHESTQLHTRIQCLLASCAQCQPYTL